MPTHHSILLCLSIAILSGCAAGGAATSLAQTSPAQSTAPTPRPSAQSPTAVAAQPADFASWRAGFRHLALAQSIRPDIFDAAFANVGVNAQVMKLDAYQPEFSRPIWVYLDSAVSDTRIANGREAEAAKRALLDSIAARHGVDPQFLLAIWGLESAYGHNYGDIRVIESLATLAYHGRRRAFAEEQLISALKILQTGEVTPSRMVGSWAGAMGHTQFIPTSYESYAVDYDGDGRRDIWAADAADALASTANYLSRFGWRQGEPWGVEARLPSGFDYTLADPSTRRGTAAWRALGVTRFGGAALPDYGVASVISPAGARGPAFVVFHNFRVLKHYNNATSYALAVGHLGDRIAGGGPFQGSWPRGDKALSQDQKIDLQQRLTGLGYDTQGADGIIGPNSRKAIRSFQSAQGMTPDGYENAAFLKSLRAASGG
ncbi:MAG: membrane-bound lytic murein transglycosylase B [Gammaproteobacteria bacterium]|jgi:membrane-bound lytic murein transglycosylase B